MTSKLWIDIFSPFLRVDMHWYWWLSHRRQHSIKYIKCAPKRLSLLHTSLHGVCAGPLNAIQIIANWNYRQYPTRINGWCGGWNGGALKRIGFIHHYAVALLNGTTWRHFGWRRYSSQHVWVASERFKVVQNTPISPPEEHWIDVEGTTLTPMGIQNT